MECGGSLGNRGRLESTALPHRDEFPSLCDCTWIIGEDFSGDYATINLNFLHFEIDHSAGHCPEDYVEIYSSGGDNRIKAPFCGDSLPESIERRGKEPFLQIDSNE